MAHGDPPGAGPRGIACLTIHSDETLMRLDNAWPVYSAVVAHPLYAQLDLSQGVPQDRVAFRWSASKSYSSNIFYRRDYINTVWSRFMTISEYLKEGHGYQDMIVLRKDP